MFCCLGSWMLEAHGKKVLGDPALVQLAMTLTGQAGLQEVTWHVRVVHHMLWPGEPCKLEPTHL
jgi:hypothetical protein